MMNLAVSKLLGSPAAPSTANRLQGGKLHMMAVLSQHQLSHGFMYTSIWTVLVLKSKKNIKDFEGVSLLLVRFLGIFLVLVWGFFWAI